MYTEEQIRKHLRYLNETIIPDLRQTGMEATAEDLSTSAKMIRQLLDKKMPAGSLTTDRVRVRHEGDE